MARAQTYEGALFYHRMVRAVEPSDRETRVVGRFGIQVTEKRPGDVFWNGKTQQFERVG